MTIQGMHRRLAARVVTTVALVAGLVGVAHAQSIKVGVVLPITSVLAAYGTPYAEALRMAVEEANAAGGVNGRQLELVLEDTQASNTVAINALNKVMDVSRAGNKYLTDNEPWKVVKTDKEKAAKVLFLTRNPRSSRQTKSVPRRHPKPNRATCPRSG